LIQTSGKEGDLPIIYLSVLNTFLKQIGEDAVKEVKDISVYEVFKKV
jgi:hypothetical protein